VEWVAREAIVGGRLVQLLDDWTPPYPGVRLYYPRHRHMTAGLRAFIDHLRSVRGGERYDDPAEA
jgi:DNA-binding transcriptional LysR family regulator